jgi:GNAT superfamily N-acetyltransferase
MPEITTQKTLNTQERRAARQLWNNEYPESLKLDTEDEFDRYLENLSGKTHYLVSEEERLVGWAMIFQREQATWFAMILDASIHGKGIGSEILQQMKAAHPSLIGWVIDHGKAVKSDGTYYASPLAFYLKNDFTVQETIRLELPTISAVQVEWKTRN